MLYLPDPGEQMHLERLIQLVHYVGVVDAQRKKTILVITLLSLAIVQERIISVRYISNSIY